MHHSYYLAEASDPLASNDVETGVAILEWQAEIRTLVEAKYSCDGDTPPLVYLHKEFHDMDLDVEMLVKARG
jgi:hypothetical protein